MSARDDYQGYVINQGQATGTENRPPTLRPHSHHLPADVYDAAMDEIDRLRAECQLQRNLLGNATGAALDVGLAGGVKPHDAIYLLAAERDVLRQALAKWKRAYDEFNDAPAEMSTGYYDSLDIAATAAERALAALVPDDLWGLGVTGGEPER